MDGQNHLKNDTAKSPVETPKLKKLSETDFNDATSFGRFKATRMWNGVMKRFRDGMPLKRHRKLMFSYEDSFTGREAVDFLMSELPKFYSAEKRITRSNCHMLLKKFIDAGLFLSVRTKENEVEDGFRENEVYRFSDIPLEKVAATPILVRRAASFNERPNFGSSCDRDCSKMSSYKFKKVDSLRSMTQDVFDPIPTSRSPLVKSRRLSSSHGNLPSMVSPKICTSVMMTPGHLILPGDDDDDENDEAGELLHSSRSDLVERKGNLSHLDEVIMELQKVGDDPANMNATLSIRSFGKVLQTSCNEDSLPGLPEHKTRFCSGPRSRLSPIRVKRTSVNDSDINNSWKQALQHRLKKLLRVDTLDGIVANDFSSADLKWNCEKIGLKGIVKARDENDDFSTYLIAMMRYLTRWPFDQKFVEKVAVYPGIERNVFENVCEHFSKGRPILPHQFATSILAIVNNFKSRSTNKSQDLPSTESSTRLETEFSAHDTPVTRFVTMLQKDIESNNTKIGCSRAENAEAGVGDPGNMATAKPHDCCFKSESNTTEEGYNQLLLKMSGLQDNSRIVLPLDGHFPSSGYVPSNGHNDYSPPSKTPRLGLSPLVASIAEEDEGDLLESVALVLLTLTPLIRRRLHYLCRFMEKICKNHCLKLSHSRENRYVVLERLSESVLSPTASINSVHCLHIVTFLVDNQGEVFSVPETFKAEVDSLLRKRQSDLKASGYGDQQHLGPDENADPPKQFCQPIKANEYDRQKEFGMEMHLLNLLDSIVTNETVTFEERKRQLRKFKRTYPEIYSKRFASPKVRKPRTPGFLNRLKALNFRQ